MKSCSGCNNEFNLLEFVIDRKSKDGRGYFCKTCRSKLAKTYRDKNKESIELSNKRWREENLETIRKKEHDYYEREKQAFKKRASSDKARETQKRGRERRKPNFIEYLKKYRIEKKEQISKSVREYKSKREKFDLNFKIANRLRSRLGHALKGGKIKVGSHVKDLGCNIKELILHLESLFYSNSLSNQKMTWDNWGKGPGKWQIDHKEALCLFDLTDRDQLLRACRYTNLQPLWYEDHVLKTVEDLKKRCTE
jgi:hypothetical protein